MSESIKMNLFVSYRRDDSAHVGEVMDGKPNGQGTMTYANGAKYVGEWKEGAKHGWGIPWGKTGDKYAGEWREGKRIGLWTGKTENIWEKTPNLDKPEKMAQEPNSVFLSSK